MRADTELIRRWQGTQDPALLEQIIPQIRPIVIAATSKWSGTLPQEALQAKSMQIATDALRTYDPSKGTLSTYLYPRLQKISRDIYTAQNVVRIPESRITMIGALNASINDLSIRLGRPPTNEEIADDMTWSVNIVKKLRSEIKNEFTVSSQPDVLGPVGATLDVMPQAKINYAYNQLDEKEKEIFDYLTGQHGKKELKPFETAMRMGISPSKVTRLKQKMFELIS